MRELMQIAHDANQAKRETAKLGTNDKNRGLLAIADALERHADEIIAANREDLTNGRENGLGDGLLDRLMLDAKRIADIAAGCRQVASLPDPVGETLWMRKTPSGLTIGQRRVPMGVIGIIYEARPNVTVDAAALCFKAGSACILRGGKEAFRSSMCLTRIMRGALAAEKLPENAINLVEDTSRETANQMMRLNGYLDVLIPRGGAGLIQAVVQNATVPVIETGTGNCHIYVDRSADLEMAKNILVNAKCQRISVCNAAESLLVHADVAEAFLPMAAQGLAPDGVKLHGCPRTQAILGGAVVPATDEDYGKEYLAYEISVKVVDSLDEAIGHINRYNTGHSECIVTRDYAASQRFLDEVDAAAVYVNASTRFTDGFEFGFGAEIGISTQKLHARGPMGLTALTSTKYVIYGNGQVR
ncbi:glutamate-5-semialdehyde dehydrogenase [Agathobaculum sp.]|uniref:glutamate-5-semialdehyde dehydrogenase n=1 Tax=Agathobaculum sp. TaxID=2048138 RepID=UPI002A7FC8F7|nr:glutamate-5-semialdehyde dehydrogenase [Agathobaculum sp.]MDY3618611.1 glutamate-5-semialdehyde dehydrogenase [Agathobaculum sp.]